MIHQFSNITSYYKRERIICSQNFILAQFFHCFNRKKKKYSRNIRIIYKNKRVKSRSGENLRKNIGWWRDTANELLFFFLRFSLKVARVGPQNGKVYTKGDERYRWQWKTVSCTFQDAENWLLHRYKSGVGTVARELDMLPAYTRNPCFYICLYIYMYTRNSVVNFDRNFLTFMPSMINVSIGIYLSKS